MPNYTDVPVERITKIGAAERQLVAAINLFFRDGDSVAVYALAGAAREIITTMCEHRGVKSFFDDAMAVHPELTKQELRKMANRYRGFLKHADKDPDVVLEDFSDYENDHILLVAGHDFGRLTRGMPIECQVFESWYLACHPEKLRPGGDIDYSAMFPNITDIDRRARKRLGQNALVAAGSDPSLKMTYSTD